VLLAGAVEVNALAQVALRQFTQWLWIEHPTFQLRGGHFTTKLLPHQVPILMKLRKSSPVKVDDKCNSKQKIRILKAV